MKMEPGTWRGIFTAFMFLAFIGTVLWAWSKRRKKDFDEAAALPLENDRFIRAGGEPVAQVPEGDGKS
jgi:cytochrome c oxidase cbb3-type subunit 4